MSELRQREPRVEDKPFLAFLRRQRCCVCGHPPPVQAAHLRCSDAANGNRNPGIGAKPDDSKAVPLCAWCHLDGQHALHKVGEEKFWKSFLTGVVTNPFVIAAVLYKEFLASGVKRLKRGVHSGRKSEVSAKGFTSAKANRSPKRPSQIKRIPDSSFTFAADKSKQKRKWPKRKMR